VSWLQIELSVAPVALPRLEQALLSVGALSITLLSESEVPVLEPNPGETPLWSGIRLKALFDLNVDMAQVRRKLVETVELSACELEVTFVGNTDWLGISRQHAVNEVFADRLWLMPKDQPTNAQSHLVPLRLEPGMAFGSGTHPTTRLCLAWIAQHVHPGQRVLDFGCGSGILGIAAALLGAEVVAVDHDEQAVIATLQNAAYNELSEQQIKVLGLSQWDVQQQYNSFDVLVANILAGPLKQLAPNFEYVMKQDKAAIILSGLLLDQGEDVMRSYASTSFTTPSSEAGWLCLIGHV